MSISLLRKQYLRANFVLVIACLAVGISYPAHSKSTSQTSKKEVLDIVFEGYYDPRKVHFESLKTSELEPSCSLKLEYIKTYSKLKPFPSEFKLYAQYKHDTTNIYIVDLDSRLDVTIFVTRNGICSTGTVDVQFHKTLIPAEINPLITDAELTGLFEDALVRHEKAFGGKALFLKWLESTRDWKVGGCKEPEDGWCPASPYDHTILPFIMEIFKNYRNKSPGTELETRGQVST